jgi:hypothetical protein
MWIFYIVSRATSKQIRAFSLYSYVKVKAAYSDHWVMLPAANVITIECFFS